jgi:hypothetical protein
MVIKTIKITKLTILQSVTISSWIVATCAASALNRIGRELDPGRFGCKGIRNPKARFGARMNASSSQANLMKATNAP